MARTHLTAQEIAAEAARLGVGGVPVTKRGVNLLAQREGWALRGQALARPRQGRSGGGGIEYHVSLMPEPLRLAMGRDTAPTVAPIRREPVSPLTLGARGRQVMAARGQILTAIRAAEATGQSRSMAIAAFLAAVAGGTTDDRFGVGPEVVRVANDRAGTSRRLARSTLYAWFRQEAEGGTAALAPLAPKAAAEVPPGFAEFLRHYAKPSKPSAAAALADYMADLADPSLALTIEQVRYTLRTKLNDIERNVGREGLLTLRARLPYVARSTDNLWPTTVYTADGHTFDAEILDPASRRAMRPELTTILDVATRKCVGLAISRKENTIAVTEALKNACVAHGIPAIFYTDRGAGYRNKALDADVGGLLGRLSITKMHALPYNSQAKGLIERFHGSVWVPLARKFASYIGVDQDKEAKIVQFRQSRRAIAEFGTAPTLPSWSDLRAACDEAVAAYNAKPHSALPKIDVGGRRRHMSPDEAWAAHVARGFEPLLVEPDLAADLFRPYEERRVARGLVRWSGAAYYDDALEAWHDERVFVGYDDADATRVWVREIDRASGQPGALICIARWNGHAQDYVPKTVQRAAEERRAKGRLARLEIKRQAVLDELTPHYLIEGQAGVTLTGPLTPEPVILTPSADAPAVPAGRPRRGFASDQELAAWAVEHPDQVSDSQARVLRSCLATEAGVAVLTHHGIDPEAVRAVLRGLSNSTRHTA